MELMQKKPKFYHYIHCMDFVFEFWYFKYCWSIPIWYYISQKNHHLITWNTNAIHPINNLVYKKENHTTTKEMKIKTCFCKRRSFENWKVFAVSIRSWASQNSMAKSQKRLANPKNNIHTFALKIWENSEDFSIGEKGYFQFPCSDDQTIFQIFAT